MPRGARFPVARPARLRNPDGNRHRESKPDDERHVEDVVGKRRRGQRQHAQPSDHERIGQRNENLADLPRGQRKRERGGQPALMQQTAEDGSGSGHEKIGNGNGLQFQPGKRTARREPPTVLAFTCMRILIAPDKFKGR